MSHDYTIRRATLADIPHLLHHRRAMFLEIGNSEEEIAPTIEAARLYLDWALADGSCRAWVAVHRASVIGGGFIVFAHWPAVPGSGKPCRPWILNVYVEPAFRRRGIARALMETMIQHCREENFPFVSLHASDLGRPLYEQMGFVPTNEMRLDLWPSRTAPTALSASIKSRS